MQLPGLLRDPAVALIGEKCYVSLIENLNLGDMDCIKYSISKGLGFGIVLGGSIVKIPQILTIVRNQSAQGLSLTSYLLETLSYAITLSYNLRQNNPFSTYGEIMFISIQNVIITLLILYFGRQFGMMGASVIGLALLIHCLNDTALVPPVVLSSLYAATIPLSLASKIPQIYTNFVNKSTGQLSVFTIVNYFAGSAARVFTTMTELDDRLMLFGNLLAAGLNGVLVLQLIAYWGKKVYKPTKLD
ncbi:mannose-P-dolichol utilization defect 1 protein [Backusella circina FSU 941]|nr:mannose-P-dolichol utilization defect 1 protein [Backusella circina FSU 941]